ncbi:MAG: CBS domain-containing protein [Candidatus Sulfotelmatobacter sp.]
MAILEDVDRSIEENEHPGSNDQPDASAFGSHLLRETLKNALSNAGLSLDEHTPLQQALREMREHRQGCVLVTSNDRLVGIFTERDVLMKIVGTNIDLTRTPIRPYMTRDPETLPADASVAYALNKMVMEGFRHVPLVDDDGRPVGVVSMRDIIEYLSGFFPKDVLNLPPQPNKSFRHREGA